MENDLDATVLLPVESTDGDGPPRSTAKSDAAASTPLKNMLSSPDNGRGATAPKTIAETGGFGDSCRRGRDGESAATGATVLGQDSTESSMRVPQSEESPVPQQQTLPTNLCGDRRQDRPHDHHVLVQRILDPPRRANSFVPPGEAERNASVLRVEPDSTCTPSIALSTTASVVSDEDDNAYCIGATAGEGCTRTTSGTRVNGELLLLDRDVTLNARRTPASSRPAAATTGSLLATPPRRHENQSDFRAVVEVSNQVVTSNLPSSSSNERTDCSPAELHASLFGPGEAPHSPRIFPGFSSNGVDIHEHKPSHAASRSCADVLLPTPDTTGTNRPFGDQGICTTSKEILRRGADSSSGDQGICTTSKESAQPIMPALGRGIALKLNPATALRLRVAEDDDAHDEYTEQFVRVGDLRYAQCSCRLEFGSNSPSASIPDLVEELRRAKRAGRGPSEVLRPLCVVRYGGRLWSLDHRRLVAVREVFADATEIAVHVGGESWAMSPAFANKFDNVTGGEHVTVHPQGGKREGGQVWGVSFPLFVKEARERFGGFRLAGVGGRTIQDVVEAGDLLPDLGWGGVDLSQDCCVKKWPVCVVRGAVFADVNYAARLFYQAVLQQECGVGWL